ncbi:nucleoside triphosphate pyrophosphohydrolase [bacterium]|jgi:tetrapyrrole methylase family protein/MazG family protein|nr:nucleoside triphosphate pyrophosphohydrolase [bacterium]
MSTKPGLESLTHVIETVHRLRAPGGCPWDRAQTHQSLRQYLIEEAYEVLDVLDQIKEPTDLQDPKVKENFREELGDLLMQVLLHSEMTSEQGVFNIYDVANGLAEKLIRRHPHVFLTGKEAKDADDALKNWEKKKAEEKKAKGEDSVLSGLPKGIPALQRAARMIEKVTKVGFQWADMKGPLDKVSEEVAELKAEVLKLEKDPKDEAARKKVEGELGDVFFTLCNVAYLMKVNPEDALRNMLQKFEGRFRYIEKRLKEQGKTPEQSGLEEMDRYWNEAKKQETKN